MSTPNPNPYNDVNNLNTFHNSNFENIHYREPNDNLFRTIRRKCSNSKLIRVISGSSLKGNSNIEPTPSAPPSQNLRPQSENQNHNQNSQPTTLYPVIN